MTFWVEKDINGNFWYGYRGFPGGLVRRGFLGLLDTGLQSEQRIEMIAAS